MRADKNRASILPFMLRCGMMLAVTLCVVISMSTTMMAQAASGSLSGTVTDETGAVIPGAKVVLANNNSGVKSETLSNDSGYFKISAVQPGAYSVTITAKGFSAWTVKDVIFHAGENHSLPKIDMKPGAEGTVVEVSADATAVPVETSESRQTLNSTMVSKLAIQGRNAAELMKIMPGAANNSGLSNSQWSSLTTQTGSGPVGGMTIGGMPPSGAVSITTDGASITDIGSGNTQVANINQERTAEMTVVNGSFGAEYNQGPVVVQSVGKSGGHQYHGSIYTYARGGTFNAQDSLLKQQNQAKPNDHYWYPGFTFGGPVAIPGLNFNKNRDKLFFFTNYEYMWQKPQGTYMRSVLPTDSMLAGDFSQASIGKLNGAAGYTPCDSRFSSGWNYNPSWGPSTCGNLLKAGYDPTVGNIGKYLKQDQIAVNYVNMLRSFGVKPNLDPSQNDGYNYGYMLNSQVNRWEWNAKVDYVKDANTKVSGSFTQQNESDAYPFGNLYWWPGGSVPFPSGLAATVVSRTFSTNFTKVLDPTLTNELSFAMTYFTLPGKVNRTQLSAAAKAVGFTSAYPYTSAGILPQIPNMVDWNCTGNNSGCFPAVYAYASSTDFGGGQVGNTKKEPSISDNLSKVWRTHTFKVGFYWDAAIQSQATLDTTAPGMISYGPWSTVSSFNELADMLYGNISEYKQASIAPMENVRRYTTSGYINDSWKASPRWTLNYGMRFEHIGQWFADNGKGFAVWDPTKYNADVAQGSTHPGIRWNAIDKSVPTSGWVTPRVLLSPRFGASYDVFGNGKTVVRGGMGYYRWQVSDGDAAASYLEPLGATALDVQNITGGMGAIASLKAPSTLVGTDARVMKKGDDAIPYTQSWNLILSQRMAGNSTLEFQYSGNRTRNQDLTNNNNDGSSLANINKIPVGTLLTSAECKGNAKYCGSAVNNTGWSANPDPSYTEYYRPYKQYRYLSVYAHGSYSNYNAFIVQWTKQTGAVNWVLNYTFSKVLGIRDGNTGNGNSTGATTDAFNMVNNHGVLAYDRSHIFNVSYVYTMPNFVKNNAFLGGVVNGWELSGVTQFQSGAPLQPNSNGSNMGASQSVNVADVLGTPDAVLMPILTCDPRKGLQNGQYFNSNCFAQAKAGSAGVLGVNGASQWPYIKGPAYFNSDLALYKNFKVTERQKVQIRVSAFNFMNHKLKQFQNNNDLKLGFLSNGNVDPKTDSNGRNWFDGTASGMTGRRVLELTLKYEF